MRRRARAEPTPRVRQEQAKHQAQRQKGPKKNRKKLGSRDMNLKKIPEEKNTFTPSVFDDFQIADDMRPQTHESGAAWQ